MLCGAHHQRDHDRQRQGHLVGALDENHREADRHPHDATEKGGRADERESSQVYVGHAGGAVWCARVRRLLKRKVPE